MFLKRSNIGRLFNTVSFSALETSPRAGASFIGVSGIIPSVTAQTASRFSVLLLRDICHPLFTASITNLGAFSVTFVSSMTSSTFFAAQWSGVS